MAAVRLLLALSLLFSYPAFAESIKATVSANVVDITSISQTETGSIEVSGTPPLYCDADASGNVMCYY